MSQISIESFQSTNTDSFSLTVNDLSSFSFTLLE